MRICLDDCMVRPEGQGTPDLLVRSQKYCCSYGAPGGTRTPDLLVRSQALYPAELRAHTLSIQRIYRLVFLIYALR